MPRVAFKQCDVERAIRAAKACGLEVTGAAIEPDGTIRVLTGGAAAPNTAPDPFETWVGKRGQRAA